MPPKRRSPSERDAERRVADALEHRGFAVYQNVAVQGAGRRGDGSGHGFADIFAERGDVGLIVEIKRPTEFRSTKQRDKAAGQATRYTAQLRAVFVAASDGNTLELTHDGKQYVHQLVDGLLLAPSTDRSPLDVGADYATFADFPKQQRTRYERRASVVVSRDDFVDLPGLLRNRACDALLISGEAGSGKTLYGGQLAQLSCWDPLLLDGSLIADPRQALLESVRDLTGFTGALVPFLRTLQGYRQRDAGVPCGIVIDSIDEWQNSRRYLYDLLLLAKEIGLFVIGFGRARSIELLMEDDRLSRFTIQRRELHQFNDEERGRASAEYIAAYDLKSAFSGHAQEMCRLPEMMALISETYAGDEINPDLTESELYERYRAKKSIDVARRANVDPARVQREIDSVALEMLDSDSVILPFQRGALVAAHLDDLLVSGILLQEGPSRNRRLRFRFGRIRDDALSAQPPETLFARSIVGRSALDYVSATDLIARRTYLRLSIADSAVDAVSLAREYNWWEVLSEVLPGSLSAQEQDYILRSAQQVLARVPGLLDALWMAPRAALFARVNHVNVDQALWRRWLDAARSTDDIHDILDLTLQLYSKDAIGIADARTALTVAQARLFRDDNNSDEGMSFWRLAAIVCEQLEPTSARRLLRALIPYAAIASSSSRAMGGSFYHGISHGGEMLKAVEVIKEKSSPRAFEAWACTALLRAYESQWNAYGFEGRELVGSTSLDGRYGDNGWVLDVIVPAEKDVIAAGHSIRHRLEQYRISRLHPAFRLRALIVAAPIADFSGLETTMLNWRRNRNTGIPSLANALDSRITELEVIGEQALDDALDRFEMPISAAQAKLFHKRLAAGDRWAMSLARQFVARVDFRNNDMFNVNFFDSLNWAESKPLFAGELIAIALLNGWDHLQLSMQRGYRDVLRLALVRPRLRGLLSQVPGIEDMLADALHGQPGALRARHVSQLYDRVSERRKRNLLRTAHELPRAAAISLLRWAFSDELFFSDHSDDSSINSHFISSDSFTGDVWTALQMCVQKWRNDFFKLLEIDVFEQSQILVSPGAIASAIMPLVSYVFANRNEKNRVSAAIDSLLALGLRGGPNLRALTADRIGPLYNGMTAEQRTRFLDEYADTAQVAMLSFYVARFSLAETAAIERAIEKAQASPHRNRIAGVLWRELYNQRRSLTSFERDIATTIARFADADALREVQHVASYWSHYEPARATTFLLTIVDRALDLRIELWETFEMHYDWSAVDLSTISDVARKAFGSQRIGWVAADIIGRGLESRTASEEAGEVRMLFELLISRSESAREHFGRWRRATARE